MIYLDNAATTKPCGEATEAVLACAAGCFGNPSSLHHMGVRAEELVNSAKTSILKRLGREGDIFFTSGATESNNLALFGTAEALKRRGSRIVTTAIEHPSVSEPIKKLSERGFEVISLKPRDFGELEEAAIEAVDEKTVLVSVMAVNNETGFVIDTKRVYEGVKRKNPGCTVHTDGVQGFCKVPLYGDTISLSGHKLHALKGIGALYKSKDVRALPLVYGGGQQKGMRSGTEPVELIASLKAAVEAYPDNVTKFSELRHRLAEHLKRLDRVIINSPENGISNILNFSVLGVRSEIMLHFLEEREIYVSSGSACSKGKLSPVLDAFGFSRERADSAIRVSFCRDNTEAETDLLAEALEAGIKRFRR
ncbi:MAG: cysteine desulfurase [Bacteroides sp.]|nr:cysteine desulfurase [Bacteroides sp.]